MFFNMLRFKAAKWVQEILDPRSKQIYPEIEAEFC